MIVVEEGKIALPVIGIEEMKKEEKNGMHKDNNR